jgi:hypothetical protein
MSTALIAILKTLLTSLLTEKALKAIFIRVAEHFAAKTENKIDDQIVADIKAALD